MNISAISTSVLALLLLYILYWVVKQKKEHDRRASSGEVCRNCFHYNKHWQKCEKYPLIDAAPNCYCKHFERLVPDMVFCRQCKHFNACWGFCHALKECVTGLSHYCCKSFKQKEWDENFKRTSRRT